jgi:hypothetical protein
MNASQMPVALLTILFCAVWSCSAAGQNSHAGPVTGGIDGVSLHSLEQPTQRAATEFEKKN